MKIVQRAIFLSLIFLFAAASFPRPVGAQSEDGPQITGVRVGFAGKYKVGHWTPVWISLDAGKRELTGQLEIVVADGDGVQTEFVTDEVVRSSAQNKITVLRYVKFGRSTGDMAIRLRDDKDIVVSRVISIREFGAPSPADYELIVTLGGDIGVDDAVRLFRRKGSEGASVVTSRIDRADQLPNRWFGYEGVDTLTITTSDPQLIEQISADQMRAIELWVQMGGRLLLSVGSRGDEMLGASGLLARFSPGSFQRVFVQRKTTELEIFANAKEPLIVPRRGRIDMTLLSDVRGRVESYEGRLAGEEPTIVRSPLGFGQVVFVAFDLDQLPAAEWQGRPRLVDRLLREGRTRREETEDERRLGRVAHIGYQDMAGQLRASLDNFDGVSLVPFTPIAVLLVVYVLLIGPADYFLLQKLFRRMEWTWITFPLVVISFCVLAYFVAGYSKGGRVRINQVELIDVDAESSFVRGTMWAHVYSPQADTYDLSFSDEKSASEPRDVLLSWQGLPGEGLGGMNSRSTSGLFRDSYAVVLDEQNDAARTTMAGMPIQTSSSKTLTARWWGQSEVGDVSRLTVSDGELRGEVTNPFPVELDGCVVTFGEFAYRLERKLKPNETIRVETDLTERGIRRHLTRQTVENIGTAWNQTDDDVPRILEMMMYYNAAGGRAYTNLAHRYQRFTDLSDHLQMNRAVLTGYTAQHTGELHRDGKPLGDYYDRQWTFYRVIFPVASDSG